MLHHVFGCKCYIQDSVYIKRGTIKTPYELWKGKTPNLSYFHVFGCKCYILNDKEHLGKFDARSDEGMFLGYSANNTTFRVYNLRSLMIMESVNIVFDDVIAVKWENDEEQKTDTPSDASKDPSTESTNDTSTPFELTQEKTTPNVHRNHSPSDVIGNKRCEDQLQRNGAVSMLFLKYLAKRPH